MKIDRSLKDVNGRPSHREVLRRCWRALERDQKRVLRLCDDSDGGTEAMHFGGDKGGGDGAGPAGERFPFDAAFIGPDGDGVAAEDFYEVDIRPSRAERRVVADAASAFHEAVVAEVVDESDGVGDAGIESVKGE